MRPFQCVDCIMSAVRHGSPGDGTFLQQAPFRRQRVQAPPEWVRLVQYSTRHRSPHWIVSSQGCNLCLLEKTIEQKNKMMEEFRDDLMFLQWGHCVLFLETVVAVPQQLGYCLS